AKDDCAGEDGEDYLNWGETRLRKIFFHMFFLINYPAAETAGKRVISKVF
ncbi:MAG: hypothetical protein UU20_C0003G0030, partial [Parcubacteria group bacterium GW2011_GWE2_40_8]